MIIETILKSRYEYVRKNYDEPRHIIMTPPQRRELLNVDQRYMEYSRDIFSERFMGILVHLAPKDLDISDWLYYGSAIDIRSEDGV